MIFSLLSSCEFVPVKSEQVNSVWYSSFACVLCMAWRGLTSTAQHVQLEIQVASTIPVRRWGSFKLRHRTVLTDWGVQATHFLKQKARLQQSWQNTNSRHILIYSVYIDFFAIFFFPKEIMNCTCNSSDPSWKPLQYLKKPWFFFLFIFFFQVLILTNPDINWVYETTQLQWFFDPQKAVVKFILKQKENTSGFS